MIKRRRASFLTLTIKTMQDDISQLLILNKKANVEQQIFASELEKFRPHQQRITATVQHQQQAIQDLTAAFKDLMDGDEAQNLQSQYDKADRLVRNLTGDFNEAKSVYFEIKEGLNRGVQFYSGVQDTVDNLNRSIQRFITERSNERNRLMDDIESSKSSREQELLRETLNKYASAPPPPPPTQSLSSSSSISHLTNQTRQMSMNEQPSSAPYNPSFTPAPPPKPQAFQQQQQQQPQSPYGMYGSSANSTPTSVGGTPYHHQSFAPPPQQQPQSPYNIPPLQQQPYAPPPPQQQPQYSSPPRPVYNTQPTYQPQYQQQAPPQQPSYYGNIQQPFQHGQPPMQGMMPPQGYQPQPQYQPQAPPQQWQQPPQQWQQQQQQQQPYQQRPPPPPGGSNGNLLD